MYASLKNRLLCLGMQVPEELKVGRRWGAGPAGGRYVLLEDTLVNVPIFGFAENSSIRLVTEEGKHLIANGEERDRIHLLENPQFHESVTSNGLPMKRIALAHGRDCVASTVHQRCVRWRQGDQCHFCGIEHSLKHGTTTETKRPDELAEVASAAEAEGFNHFTLTTGTPSLKDKGAGILSQAAKAVKESAKMHVHVQLEPVERNEIEMLHSSGSDSIGIHIESLDKSALERVCPGKAGDWNDYFRAWDDSIDIFGSNQVSSYVILGLGENKKATLTGIDRMCQEGVIPYIVPLRPMEETLLQDSLPPPPNVTEEFYAYASEKMKEYGIDPTKNLAGCVRCGGCSALTDFYRG